MKRIFPLALAAIVSLITLVVGCGVKPPMTARHDPYPADQISVASVHLKENTAIGTPIATRDDVGDILYVTIPIRSTTNEQLYVDYRYSFFDRNGQVLSQSGWMTRTLTPNVPDSIMVKSGNARAADFHVDFRDAK